MASYNIDRRVRCWTCKANGIDRFFIGNEERQLHESALHDSELHESALHDSTLHEWRDVPEKWATASNKTHNRPTDEFGSKQSESCTLLLLQFLISIRY